MSSGYAQGDTARCCAPHHVGPRVLPLARFYGIPPRVRASGYCRECHREWRHQKQAAARGEVAAEGVGPDFTALAEAELFPGRGYHELTPAERRAATDRARALASAAGVYPTAAPAAA